MRDEEKPPNARVNAASAILDRAFGKPTQTVDATTRRVDPESLSDEQLVAFLLENRGGEPAPGEGQFEGRRFRMFIATSSFKVLRRPLGSAQYVSIKYTERLVQAGVEPSVGSVGDSYDNALAERINGLYKAESSIGAGHGGHRDAGMGGLVQAEERYYAMLEQPAMAA